MSNTQIIRKKLAMLRKSPAKELLYDAMMYYLSEVCGMAEQQGLVEEIEEISKALEQEYLQQIPKKVPKVKHVDLEDSIKEIKAERGNGNSRHPKYG